MSGFPDLSFSAAGKVGNASRCSGGIWRHFGGTGGIWRHLHLAAFFGGIGGIPAAFWRHWRHLAALAASAFCIQLAAWPAWCVAGSLTSGHIQFSQFICHSVAGSRPVTFSSVQFSFLPVRGMAARSKIGGSAAGGIGGILAALWRHWWHWRHCLAALAASGGISAALAAFGGICWRHWRHWRHSGGIPNLARRRLWRIQKWTLPTTLTPPTDYESLKLPKELRRAGVF